MENTENPNKDLPINAQGEVELSVKEFFTWAAENSPNILIGDTNHIDPSLIEKF